MASPYFYTLQWIDNTFLQQEYPINKMKKYSFETFNTKMQHTSADRENKKIKTLKSRCWIFFFQFYFNSFFVYFILMRKRSHGIKIIFFLFSEIL